MLSRTAFVFASALALAAGCRDKAAPGHDHAHGDPQQAAQGLTLKDGKRWPTDATLRTEMSAIRNELQAAMQPIHENTYSAAQYKALAGKIEAHIGTIVAKCKLEADADAQLHTVLSQLAGGTDLMKKEGAELAGAIRTFEALEGYARYFDHPGWKPLEH
jgi:hypothetical protein